MRRLSTILAAATLAATPALAFAQATANDTAYARSTNESEDDTPWGLLGLLGLAGLLGLKRADAPIHVDARRNKR